MFFFFFFFFFPQHLYTATCIYDKDAVVVNIYRELCGKIRRVVTVEVYVNAVCFFLRCLKLGSEIMKCHGGSSRTIKGLMRSSVGMSGRMGRVYGWPLVVKAPEARRNSAVARRPFFVPSKSVARWC